MQQHTPHPDSWRRLMRSYQSTCSTSGKQLCELHVFLHSSASRVMTSASSRGTSVAAGQPRHAGMQGTGVSLARPAGLRPLQLPSGSSDREPCRAAVHGRPAAATRPSQHVQAAAFAAAGRQPLSSSGGTDNAENSGKSGPALPGGSGCVAGAGSTSSAAIIESTWPEAWEAEDVAWLCQLAQAEELLETAVHLLLGIGEDSSDGLYERLRQMTRGQQLSMEVRDGSGMLQWYCHSVRPMLSFLAGCCSAQCTTAVVFLPVLLLQCCRFILCSSCCPLTA